MKSWAKGLVLAAVHVGLVASLGAKLLYDRATRPRVWALTAPYDPDLPIRGRYLSLQLVVEPRGIQGPQPESAWQPQSVTLHVADGRLVAEGNAQERGFNPADLHVRFIDRRCARSSPKLDRAPIRKHCGRRRMGSADALVQSVPAL